MSRVVRSQRAAIAEVGDAILLVGRAGVVRRLESDTAELARAVLEFTSRPRTREDILAHVGSLSGTLDDAQRAVVLELLELLERCGALVPVSDATRPPGTSLNIVVAASGAIAATHVPALVTALLRRGHRVEVALTQTANRFVSSDALAAIVGHEIHTSTWPSRPFAPVPHVALAHWADLVVVYPASATTIGRIAHGDFSDLVSAISITTRAPVVVVPSMNVDMLEAPTVQRNLATLREDGAVVIASVPSQEVADAPSVRALLAGAAPSPGEVVATLDALRAAGVLVRRDAGKRRAETPAEWDAVYRAAETSPDGAPPWETTLDRDDVVAVLPVPAAGRTTRLLDVGCGTGHVARRAASLGYAVVASDVSEVALRIARDRDPATSVTWVRDDICATGLLGPFDVVVDRATLHTLTSARTVAWAHAMRRLVRPGGTLVVVAPRDGVDGVTTGWSAEALAAMLVEFEVAQDAATMLPGLRDATPVPARLVVLRRLTEPSTPR